MASFHLFTGDSLLDARRFFQRATELDPNYPSPYGMAAWCVLLSKTNGWLLDPEREIAEGVKMARRAVALGKDNATALWSSGHSLAYLAAEVETGAAYIDRAIVLNPNLAAAWSVSGWSRIYLGEPAKAIEHLERSRRLSPLDPIAYMGYTGMALAHLLADHFEEAVSWAAKARTEQPTWATSLRVAAIAYALSDRIVEAREAMARLREIDPNLRLSNVERVVTVAKLTSAFEQRRTSVERPTRAQSGPQGERPPLCPQSRPRAAAAAHCSAGERRADLSGASANRRE